MENIEIVNGVKEYLSSISNILSDIEKNLPEGIRKIMLRNLHNMIDIEFSRVVFQFKNMLEFSKDNDEKIIIIQQMQEYVKVVDKQFKEILKGVF